MRPIKKLDISLLVRPEDILEGLAFLESHYQRAFGVSPSSPDYLLTAREAGDIVGTIGVNFGSADRGLRLARLYIFDHAHAPLPIDFERTVEFGKWVSEVIGVSAALVHAAICFSLSEGKAYAWCEHTAALNRVCQRFGIIFHKVADAQLDRSQIEEHHRKFYENNDVQLYMFDLYQAHKALRKYLDIVA